MASGFLALLDDISILARNAAASLDDITAAAVKASAKSAGVVIDDAAVTPQYVRGVEPKRELSVVKRIALGSLRNKFFYILPVALIFSELAPWVLPVLLIVGGTYLAFEGAEKVLGWFGHHPHQVEDETPVGRDSVEFEKKLVAGAVRTDLILSAEIMLITLANVDTDSFWERLGILAVVAIIMTAVVYGAVALLVKMDDFGLLLSRARTKVTAAFGRGLVKAMPHVFTVISVIGTLAMLWVGGHILIKSLHDLGFDPLYDALHHVTDSVSSAGGLVEWLVDTGLSAVFGLAVGLLAVYAVSVFSRVRAKRVGSATKP